MRWPSGVGWPSGGFGAVALLVASVSCAHGRVAAPRVELAEGRTSVRALNTPTVETGTPDPSSERITPAYASPENLPPEYPAYALKAGCRNGVVAVRVYLGADGNVTAQRDVPERPLPNDSCHVAFRAAVQGAVGDWRFAPAFRLKAVPGRDPGDGRPPLVRWEQSPIAVYLDFEFSFEVVRGKGVVRGR